MQLSCINAREVLTAGAEKQSFISSCKVESPVLRWPAMFFNKQPQAFSLDLRAFFMATEIFLYFCNSLWLETMQH